MSIRAFIPLNRFSRASKAPKSYSSICLPCNSLICPNYASRIASESPSRWRNFSSIPPLFKKSGKANRSQAKTDSSPPIDVAAKNTAVDDAFDFSGLQAKILKATEQLAHELSQLRAGGRFNPEKLEQLNVQLKPSSEGEKPSTVKLRDLAQVVAKGRVVSVICHEQDHVKSVNSAILASKLNLTPRAPTEEAPTTLTIQIPPPTGESRQQALASASKAAEEALGKTREARGGHQKKLRSMQVAKKVRPDDLQKAQQQMENVVKHGNEEIKKILENSKKVLEG